MYSGTIDDFGWNYQQEQSRLYLENEWNSSVSLETDYLENIITEQQVNSSIITFIDKGYTIFISTGSQQIVPVVKNAQVFLEKYFIIVSSPLNIKNYSNIVTISLNTFRIYYFFGMLSGMLFKDQYINICYIISSYSDILDTNAFALGYISMSNKTEIDLYVINTWDNITIANYTINLCLQKNISIIIQNTMGLQINSMLKQYHNIQNVYSFGEANDLRYFEGYNILSSILRKHGYLYLNIIQNILQNSFVGGDNLEGDIPSIDISEPSPYINRTLYYLLYQSYLSSNTSIFCDNWKMLVPSMNVSTFYCDEEYVKNYLISNKIFHPIINNHGYVNYTSAYIESIYLSYNSFYSIIILVICALNILFTITNIVYVYKNKSKKVYNNPLLLYCAQTINIINSFSIIGYIVLQKNNTICNLLNVIQILSFLIYIYIVSCIKIRISIIHYHSKTLKSLKITNVDLLMLVLLLVLFDMILVIVWLFQNPYYWKIDLINQQYILYCYTKSDIPYIIYGYNAILCIINFGTSIYTNNIQVKVLKRYLNAKEYLLASYNITIITFIIIPIFSFTIINPIDKELFYIIYIIYTIISTNLLINLTTQIKVYNGYDDETVTSKSIFSK